MCILWVICNMNVVNAIVKKPESSEIIIAYIGAWILIVLWSIYIVFTSLYLIKSKVEKKKKMRNVIIWFISILIISILISILKKIIV